TQLQEQTRDDHHASAAPDPAFDDRAWDAIVVDIVHRGHQIRYALGRSHRIWARIRDHLPMLGGKILIETLSSSWSCFATPKQLADCLFHHLSLQPTTNKPQRMRWRRLARATRCAAQA